MKRLFAVALLLCMLCASALADSLVTNGGVSLDTGDLPYCTEDESAPVVYFISDISPESSGQGLSGAGRGAARQGGRQDVHRREHPQQLPAAGADRRSDPSGERHHRGVQHRLRRQPLLHRHAPAAGQGQRPSGRGGAGHPGRGRQHGDPDRGRRPASTWIMWAATLPTTIPSWC